MTLVKTLYRPRNLALALGAVTVLLAGLLYGIGAFSVHGTKPDALKELNFLVSPVPAPQTAFVSLKGEHRTLDEFRGRYVLVNLWATWCAPCVEELPALANLQAEIPRDKFEILAVSAGRGTLPEAAEFLEDHQAGALSLYGDRDLALMRAFKAYGLPASILIDPEGKEIARAMGAADWDAPAAIAWFKARVGS